MNGFWPMMFLLKRDAVDKFPGTLPSSLEEALNSFFSDYRSLCGRGEGKKKRLMVMISLRIFHMACN